MQSDVVLLVFTNFIVDKQPHGFVAIGEVVAIVLILRRYPTIVAISMSVTISAISVLTSAYYDVAVIESVNWSIILFAISGVILCGTIT